jgi:hypothetical protein
MTSYAERISDLPPPLANALREAIRGEDTRQLVELADGVAEHDSEVAAYLRDLIERYAFDVMADLFDAPHL